MSQCAEGGTYVPKYRLGHVHNLDGTTYQVGEPFMDFGQRGHFVSRLEEFQRKHAEQEQGTEKGGE